MTLRGVELEPSSAGGEMTIDVHLTGVLDRRAFGIRPRRPFEMVVGGEVLLDVELS